MTQEEKYAKAMDLLNRAADKMEDESPDRTWLGEFYELTGDHMICTKEGWEDGENKQSYIDGGQEDSIICEVNAPVAEEPHGS
jgi:hypothetical protein